MKIISTADTCVEELKSSSIYEQRTGAWQIKGKGAVFPFSRGQNTAHSKVDLLTKLANLLLDKLLVIRVVDILVSSCQHKDVYKVLCKGIKTPLT